MMTKLFTLLFVILTIKTTISTWPSECQNSLRINNVCYILMTSPNTYDDAQRYCENRNGKLAIIKNSKTMSEITNVLSSSTAVNDDSRIWIGVNDKSSEGTYRYSDGTAVDYFNWYYNEPTQSYSLYSENDCVSINGFTGQWYDDPCSRRKRYLCQFEGDSCSIGQVSIKNAEYKDCYSSKKLPFDSELSIKCQEGFVLVGPSSVKCTGNGVWSEMPKCLRGCIFPPDLPNSALIGKKDYYVVDDNVTYICDEDYFSNTNPVRSHFTMSCLSDGQWSPVQTGCSHSRPYKVTGAEVLPESIISSSNVRLKCDVRKTNFSMNISSGIEENSGGLYFWSKDSIELVNLPLVYEIEQNGDLILYSNSTQDISGIYACVLSGDEIIPGKTVYDVQVSKDVCNVSSEKSTYYLYKEGSSAWLSCPHDSSYAGFHWFKDGEYFPLNAEQVLYPDGSLYIKKVDFSHQGNFTCMMTKKDTFCSKNITAEVVVLASAKSICGNPSKAKDHPWTVSLWRKDEVAPFCYGSLIHESWVVTTAQCLSGLYRKRKLDIFVRLGKSPIIGSSSKEIDNEAVVTDIPISTVKIHPLFSKRRYANDIGLVQLKRAVQFSKTIQPICLTEKDLTAKAPCDRSPPLTGITSGWGALEKDDVDEMILQEEAMTLVNMDFCSVRESQYTDKVLCFQKTSDTEDTFASDSGSPMELLWKGRIYLLGVYSWGDRIAQLGKYDYFTRISDYASWISSYLAEN